VEEEGMRSI